MDVLQDWLRVMRAGGVVPVHNRMPLRWGFRASAREGVAFHVVTEGSCWLRCPGTDTLQLLQGEMVFLPHGPGHDLANPLEAVVEPFDWCGEQAISGDAEHSSATVLSGFYELDAETAEPMLRSLPTATLFNASRIRANPALSSALNLLTTEFDRRGPGSDALVGHLFDALFVLIAREWSIDVAATGSGWLAALKDESLSKALGRMHSTPGAPWTVETLAKAAGMSRATFARRFTSHMGEPPLGYLTRWRMLLAANRLREGVASISTVARTVGYDSEFAFSRAFKRHHGVAPTGFRRGSRVPELRSEPAVEMAKVMGPDDDREYVSVFDASGLGRVSPAFSPKLGR